MTHPPFRWYHHISCLIIAVALWDGAIWLLAYMFWPLPLSLHWYYVLPVAIVVGSVVYCNWWFNVCHLCELYDSQTARPKRTLDERGCCRDCKAYWVGQTEDY
jgi:hypothetical protein